MLTLYMETILRDVDQRIANQTDEEKSKNPSYAIALCATQRFLGLRQDQRDDPCPHCGMDHENCWGDCDQQD